MIAYSIEENRVLKEQLESGGRRLRFTDDQRRRLAAKGKPLGRKVLRQIATIVTPDTILARASSKSENALVGYSSTIIDGRREMDGLSPSFGHYEVENLGHAVSLHFMYYNFVRIHQSLRVTPAMEAGVTDHLWDMGNIIDLIEQIEKGA